MNKDSKIFVAGHAGLVGSALMRLLTLRGYHNCVVRSQKDLDLRDQRATETFFQAEKPDYVFLAAARVGGILANSTYPADFSYDNLMIAANVIHASYLAKVKKLLFLGSSCIYPRMYKDPIKEENLLAGPLEKTNEPYAIAKIAGITLCQSYNRQYGTVFISGMPTNLYGPCDNFDLATAHVVPALIRKIYYAKEQNLPTVTIWGTGKPMREFLYVDDLADALIFLMNSYSGNEIVNIGVGTDMSIFELAQCIKKTVGYEGAFIFDVTKPDGTERKLFNVDKIHALGWHAQTSLIQGIQKTVDWYARTYARSHMSVQSVLAQYQQGL